MYKKSHLYTLLVIFVLLTSCGSGQSEDNKIEEEIKLTKFTGNYNKSFNDLHDLHIAAATKNGIYPMALKKDTARLADKLVRLPQELPLYRIDKLTHSVPFLVPKASDLLIEICADFRDSLISKKIPVHKLILTSLTRTTEDIQGLTKRNFNASHNSAHCYGTTFDISWKRFEPVNPYSEKKVSTDRLKYVLGEVLHNLRQQKKCYIKHEKKQACFHITVR